MPVWIRVISLERWPSSTKRMLILGMVAISAGFSIYGFLNPNRYPSQLSIWAGNIGLAIYIVAIAMSAYINWPQSDMK
jgi:hypothetical protein